MQFYNALMSVNVSRVNGVFHESRRVIELECIYLSSKQTVRDSTRSCYKTVAVITHYRVLLKSVIELTRFSFMKVKL